MKKIVLNILILLFTFNVALLGNSVSTTVSSELPVPLGSSIEAVETVEVALDSFGTFGIILMIGLSSLVGVFFLKDEFSEVFK